MTTPAHDVLRVLDTVRTIHHSIDIARLERIWSIYRSWINVPGLEGGTGLTRDELACVLECQDDDPCLDFLLHTFSTSPQNERVDMLTLLITAVCVARGSLIEKARLVFRLVDFDVEDEIVEDELAMVVAACMHGLFRLGVLSFDILDADARAIAYEAFEFVGVDDGAKLPLTQFVKWIVAHPRPRSLFERLQ
ncbi:hypothetical protein PINS_up013762 [Pythium insidiosum]|nr:hypothetical protein PINS_up013762 [Pythium insidiosum]